MRFFLKKTNRPKGEYLQIYQSEYIRGVGSRNKSYKAIGYVDELIATPGTSHIKPSDMSMN